MKLKPIVRQVIELLRAKSAIFAGGPLHGVIA